MAADLAAGLIPLVGLTVATWWILALSATYLFRAIALYLVASALILLRIPPDAGGPGMGWANRVTLARTTLVLPVAGLVVHPGAIGPLGYWWALGVAGIAMVLDGVDGRVARRTATVSDFGGRFDMELDAFLLLALSILVWQSGQVGPWVILIGALRYLFVGAGWFRPALRNELPPSRRRQTICVVQGLALLVCLAPAVPSTWASLVAAVALGLLVCSFAVDVWWLRRRSPVQSTIPVCAGRHRRGPGEDQAGPPRPERSGFPRRE